MRLICAMSGPGDQPAVSGVHVIGHLAVDNRPGLIGEIMIPQQAREISVIAPVSRKLFGWMSGDENTDFHGRSYTVSR